MPGSLATSKTVPITGYWSLTRCRDGKRTDVSRNFVFIKFCWNGRILGLELQHFETSGGGPRAPDLSVLRKRILIEMRWNPKWENGSLTNSSSSLYAFLPDGLIFANLHLAIFFANLHLVVFLEGDSSPRQYTSRRAQLSDWAFITGNYEKELMTVLLPKI